jgi:hypothetical protein
MSAYEIEFSPAAEERLGLLAPEGRTRLLDMLHEIAALADELAPADRQWTHPRPEQLLYLSAGACMVRYAIDVRRRLVRVEHLMISRSAKDDVA